MGQEIHVDWPSASPCPLGPVLEKLAEGGLTCFIVMVEGNLQAPQTPPPSEWREVRLKCQAGTIALRRGSDGIHVVIFGNADDALREAQQRVAAAVRASLPS